MHKTASVFECSVYLMTARWRCKVSFCWSLFLKLKIFWQLLPNYCPNIASAKSQQRNSKATLRACLKKPVTFSRVKGGAVTETVSWLVTVSRTREMSVWSRSVWNLSSGKLSYRLSISWGDRCLLSSQWKKLPESWLKHVGWKKKTTLWLHSCCSCCAFT